MYVTTVYDLAKDCNMMLDKSLIDCFEEITIDSEQLEELIENYNHEQQLGIINTSYQTNDLNINNTLEYNMLEYKILEDTLDNALNNHQQNNYEKLNKNKIHNYLYPINEKERENNDTTRQCRNTTNRRTGKNDSSIKRDEHFKNRTNRHVDGDKEFVRRKRYNYNRNNPIEQFGF